MLGLGWFRQHFSHFRKNAGRHMQHQHTTQHHHSTYSNNITIKAATQATAPRPQHNRNSKAINKQGKTRQTTPTEITQTQQEPGEKSSIESPEQHTSITVKHIQDQHFQQTAKHSNPTKNPFQTFRRYSTNNCQSTLSNPFQELEPFFLVMTNIINKRSSWLVLIRVGRE